MKDWLILLGIGIVAFLAFYERDLWMPQSASTASTQSRVLLPASPGVDGTRLLEPVPTLADSVARSQQAAVTKYPALKVPGSEMNIRFTFRYKNLLADHSPRLQDPAWPLQLADECAQDAHVRPVTATGSTTPAQAIGPAATSLAATPRAATRPSSGVSQPANTALQSLRVPSTAPAPAQTLVFHPGSVGSAPSEISRARPLTGPLPFVTLDAVNQKSANDFRYNWFYGYDYYDISFRQSVGISINVRNMSRDPAAVNVRWMFFARQAHNSERFIFGASGKELDLAPGQTEALAADSPTLQRREMNDSSLGQRYLSGSKYEGWLVQLVERGSNRIIKQTGSTSYLEDLAKKTDFSTLVDDYKNKLRGQGGADAPVFTR